MDYSVSYRIMIAVIIFSVTGINSFGSHNEKSLFLPQTDLGIILYVDGIRVDHPIYPVRIELPPCYTDVPNVTAEPNDSSAYINVKQAENFTDTTVITVTAADSSESQTYYVMFEQSHNTDLKELYVNGEEVPINGNIYTYEIPYYVDEVPAVEAASENTCADLEIEEAENLNDTTEIIVTAESGYKESYFIIFKKLPTTLGGNPISDVSIKIFPNPTSDQLYFTVDLPKSMELELRIINLNGQIIKQIHSGMLAAGNHQFGFDLNGIGKGVYFVKGQIDDEQFFVDKIILE